MTQKIKNFFLSFSLIFLIAAITSFTAYNWKSMNNLQKLGLPSALILLGLIGFILLKQEKYKNLALFFSCFIIGTLFAVFGQVYQTGADSWILFRNWAFFLVIPVIFSMSYSIILLFITVLTAMLYFHLSLFLDGNQAMFIACLIPGFIIAVYPFITKKFNFDFNNFFYNSLVIPFYVIFNFVGIGVVIDNSRYYYLVSEDSKKIFPIILLLAYPTVLALLFFIGKKMEKYIIIPFSIISAGFFIWAYFTSKVFDIYTADTTFYFIVSLAIFIITFTILVKSIPPIKNEFIKRIFNALANVSKLFIFIFGIGLVISIIFVSGAEEVGFLIIGIGLLILSCFLPKILNFKEDRLEVISFAIGLLSLTFYLTSTFEDRLDFFTIACFEIIMFDIFWYFRPNKIMDFLFAGSHYAFILAFLYKFNFIFTSFATEREATILNIHFLSLIGLLLIPLQLFYSKKIEISKHRDKINRVFFGNTLCLLAYSVNFSFMFEIFYFSRSSSELTYFFKLISVMRLIRTVIIIALSIIITVLINNKENSINISENNKFVFLNDKSNLKNVAILSALIFMIQLSSYYIAGTGLIILLILFYTYKKYKWTSYLLNILLYFHIFYYYYSLSETTLLKKSQHMFVMSVALLIAYLIMKYFIKGVSSDEK